MYIMIPDLQTQVSFKYTTLRFGGSVITVGSTTISLHLRNLHLGSTYSNVYWE